MLRQDPLSHCMACWEASPLEGPNGQGHPKHPGAIHVSLEPRSSPEESVRLLTPRAAMQHAKPAICTQHSAHARTTALHIEAVRFARDRRSYTQARAGKGSPWMQTCREAPPYMVEPLKILKDHSQLETSYNVRLPMLLAPSTEGSPSLHCVRNEFLTAPLLQYTCPVHRVRNVLLTCRDVT